MRPGADKRAMSGHYEAAPANRIGLIIFIAVSEDEKMFHEALTPRTPSHEHCYDTSSARNPYAETDNEVKKFTSMRGHYRINDIFKYHNSFGITSPRSDIRYYLPRLFMIKFLLYSTALTI